ncbi:hypothetical protein J8J14_13625 [Roseomonas sp. SSH11]|uniref:Uncharacterized protein n=1 Tax=Pararoseomonas baculiformis TaxID=2820812 RepID=A0ABS4AFK2_9PROT|nr:hypothetical protein [Pararoseomonas baculiformis]MBP0445815.1 hypothetical protein [Pararoseomonas baculiformis]
MTRRGSLSLTSAAALTGLAALTGCAVAQEPWPNLNDAEAQLRGALESLNRAPNRFAGHKAEAERLIRGALTEIEMAKQSFR